jgi:hypothetical protein
LLLKDALEFEAFNAGHWYMNSVYEIKALQDMQLVQKGITTYLDEILCLFKS